MYDELSAKDKVIIAYTQKKVRYFFDSKCDLKERKRTKKEKEGMPPHPHAKEKENKKEKDEKTHTHLKRVADLDLEEDQIAFWNECKQFIGKEYSYKMVQSFFCALQEKRDASPPTPASPLTPLQRARGTLRARGVNSQITKLKLLKSWLLYNPRLRNIAKKKGTLLHTHRSKKNG